MEQLKLFTLDTDSQNHDRRSPPSSTEVHAQGSELASENRANSINTLTMVLQVYITSKGVPKASQNGGGGRSPSALAIYAPELRIVGCDFQSQLLPHVKHVCPSTVLFGSQHRAHSHAHTLILYSITTA